MTPYPRDRIAGEQPDPIEQTSSKFLPIPFLLWCAFAVFGLTYLGRQTPHTGLAGGDQRSAIATVTAPSQANPSDLGAALYRRHCQACHQPQGQGVAGAFPPLADSEWVLGDPHTLSAIVWHGLQGKITVKGTTYQGVMPGFGKQLQPEEVAALLTYLRRSWGHQADPVPSSVVEEMIQRTHDRKQPWKGEAELQQAGWETP